MIRKTLAVGIILLFIVSAVSPMVIGYNVNENSLVLSSTNTLDLLSKSSGLENPDKEEGKTELELADINNDGHLDIICVGDHGSPYINSGQHGIMVWLGDGVSTWSVEQVGNFGYGGIEAGDLNLDGYLDVVWGIHHAYGETGFGDTLIGAALGDGTATNWEGWATGLGTGGEEWGMFATDLADFNCNGLLDIISQSFGSGNGYHLYENHGDGSWSHEWAMSGENTYNNIETGDFNADGYPDFVGNREGTYVYLGDGSFDFTLNQDGLPTGGWNGLDCGDMNNDGCDDLVIGYSSSGVRCYKYDKQNDDWDLTSDGLPTSGYHYPQFGDIDGDGNLDIITYSKPTGYVFLGDGDGNWVADATFTMPSDGGYSAFVVDGDFDHDGREDIIIQAREGSWPSYENKLKAFSPWLEPTELTASVSIPHGGETFRSGSIRNIRWLSAVPPSQGDATVEIQLSQDSASGPWATIISGIPNNGCYQWLVDTGGSEYCRIKVIVTTSSSTSAISSSDFIIIGFNVDAHGPYFGTVDEPVQFTGSAENGTEPYSWHWGFGDGETSDEQNPAHTYDNPGNYTVTLTVTDDEDNISVDTTWAWIQESNYPPNKPTITGETHGKFGESYDYTFISTDPEDQDVWYYIDWGDDQYEEWIGPFESGEEVIVSHTWEEKDTYSIKAKAKDIFDAESEWGTLEVTMPVNQQSTHPWLHWFLERFPFLEYLFNMLF